MSPVQCLCGAGDDELVGEVDRYGLPLRTVLCRACGVMRSDPYFDSESIGHFYADLYRGLYESGSPEEAFSRMERSGRDIISRLKRVLGSIPHQVLELGAGAGGNLVAFQEAGHQVVGFDYNEDYLDYGRSRGLSLHFGGLGSDPIEVERDGERLILMIHVFEHFADPRAALRALAEICQEGDYVYLELPGVLEIGKAYVDPVKFFQNAHAFHYTGDHVMALFGEVGFDPLFVDQSLRGLFLYSGVRRPLIANPAESHIVRRSLTQADRWRFVRKVWNRLLRVLGA